MIWTTDAAGYVTYVCPTWEQLTGQPPKEAGDFGWIDCVHPDDRTATERMFRRASEVQKEFFCVYRLCIKGGGFIWVVDGATPSFGQVHGEFLGFLGSTTEIDAPIPPKASGEFGLFRPPRARQSTPTLEPIDMIADLALVARMIARESGDEPLIEIFDVALQEIATRLSGSIKRIHH